MISEERLRQAAGAAALALTDCLPAPEECQHEFSPGFDRRMRKVLRRGNHPTVYRGLRRVASFLLVLLLSGSIWLAVDTEAREAVFGWISERVEGAYHYFFRGERTSQNYLTEYTLSKIPEGYHKKDVFETDSYTETTYLETATGRYLSLGWLHPSTETETPELFFLTGDMEREQAQVNGRAAEFYRDDTGNNANVIVWRDEERATLLYLSGYFDKESLIDLAENVK
jgi:hypothetical protein